MRIVQRRAVMLLLVSAVRTVRQNSVTDSSLLLVAGRAFRCRAHPKPVTHYNTSGAKVRPLVRRNCPLGTVANDP
jgi:hypothetical protein